METEAKLGFNDKESLYALTTSDVFLKFCDDDNTPEPLLLENSYLDTEDMSVSHRGGMIRVRHYNSKTEDFYEFTVKYGGFVSDGIHKRYEWNVRSEDGRFSVEGFKQNAANDNDPSDLLSEVFCDIKDEDLKVICSNSFTRTVYNLTYGASGIEACFDSGVITNPDNSMTDEICEMELELINGNVEDLNNLKDYFIEKTGCFPFENTKYKRTLAMAAGRSE